MIKAPPPVRDRKLELPELLALLVKDGMISAAQAKDLTVKVGSSNDTRHPLISIGACEWPNALTPQRKLTTEALTQWYAPHAGLGYFRIDPLSIDVSRVTSVIPYAYAARAKILPVKVTPTEITVAVGEPYRREWERDLGPAIKQKITRVLSNPADIERYIVEFYALAKSVKGAEEERAGQPASGVQNLEQLIELGRSGKLDANDQHIVAIVDWLLQYAFDQRASDIHLEPRRDTGNIRFRIDGVLHEVYQVPSTIMAAITSRIKILSRLDLAEKRRPQDGRIKSRTPAGKEVELRVSSLPTAFGEKVVMRIFDPEVLVKNFAALGFSAEDEKQWRDMIAAPHGIILVTGPTGSGKTTTLYSSLKQLATPEVNVCSIEDPIELVEPSFNQMQVNAAIDLTFADGVRALLRQDPDIIMVGEIRDLETAEIAIQAALTGHLVLSTLHTNDAPSAVTRLMELGVPGYLIKATLLGVVAQRLLRTLCKHCQAPLAPETAQWREVAGDLPVPKQIQQAVGCLECRETGYKGRAGIYEILRLTPEVSRHIGEQMDVAEMRSAARKSGMMSLRDAGLRKIVAGVTTIDEVLGTTPPPGG